MRRDDLGKICWDLRKRPRVLLIFLVIPFLCSKKFNFISDVKPKCFWNKLLLSKILLNKRVGWNYFLICLPLFTPGRCPTWLKKIQLEFCNPYGGVKTISKNLFHMLRSLARISWDTGVSRAGKSCFFFHYKFSNWSSKSGKALIDL